MNMSDAQLRLLAGMPIEIDHCGSIHIPTVREVIQLGESKYNEHLYYPLFDRNNLEGDLDERITNFDIVFNYCKYNMDFRQGFYDAVKFIFKEETLICDYEKSDDEFFYLADGTISKNNFDEIQAVLRLGHHLKVPEKVEGLSDYNPANEAAAEFIREMLENRRNKPKPPPTSDTHSMISGLAWKSGSPNIDPILDLTIYQLYDGYKRITNIDSIHYTMFGIYTGNVDFKSIKEKDLSFIKILDSK